MNVELPMHNHPAAACQNLNLVFSNWQYWHGSVMHDKIIMFTISLVRIESIEQIENSDLDIGLDPSVDVERHHAIICYHNIHLDIIT
jgi:hypothetical protein